MNKKMKGLFNHDFLESLARAEKDYKAGRVTKLKSLKDLENKNMTYKFTIIINKEGKWYVARSIELGVASQGKTVEEAQKNLKEAVELYLEDNPKAKSDLSKAAPLITTFDLKYY